MTGMWHYGEPEAGVLQVGIDCTDRSVNALSTRGIDELRELIRHIRERSDIKAVTFSSRKPGNFIAGADLHELREITSEADALALSREGQQVFAELSGLKAVTVTLISGSCLGGGLEFAMACDYRVASDEPATLLGLPEVQLGLLPGWGGTVRLPQLVGFLDALPLLLTGRKLNPYQARSRGLIHDVVPVEALPTVGQRVASELSNRRDSAAAARRLFRTRRKSLWKRLLNNRLVHRYALRRATAQVEAETGGHYPAPLKIIDVLSEGLGQPEKKRLELEARGIATLATNPVTAECIRLFFLQESARKTPPELSGAMESVSVDAVGVIGAGAMGAGIAGMTARKGIRTRLHDISPDGLGAGLRRIHKLVGGDRKRRRLSRRQASEIVDNISPSVDHTGLKHADIVIEAILEDLEIKRGLWRDLEQVTSPTTVLATNTSSLCVGDMLDGLSHPERVLGLHFFNPPRRMPLVEVIGTEHTSPEALATALAFVKRVGKTPVVVGDCAGFLVNRLLTPYMNEAGYLLVELEDPMEIERAAVEFGMPMGPLELTDLVGIDVAMHVARNMRAAYGERMEPSPLWSRRDALRLSDRRDRRLVEKGRDGKSINKHVLSVASGIRESQRLATAVRLSREEITERLIYPLINEAARCLADGITRSAEDLDLAMVLGTGFAPFRGGPMRYAVSVGLPRIVTALDGLSTRHPRLAPSDALRQYAESGSFENGVLSAAG